MVRLWFARVLGVLVLLFATGADAGAWEDRCGEQALPDGCVASVPFP